MADTITNDTMKTGSAPPATRVSSLLCMGLYIGGTVLFFMGERIFQDTLPPRLTLDGVGLALMVVSLALRIRNRTGSSQDFRAVEGTLALFYLGGLAALALYGLQIEELRAPLSRLLTPGGAVPRYRVILQVLWPIVWVGSILPALFMEASYASMARGSMIETNRIRSSTASGLAIALTACILFVLNYVADEHNIKRDLSFLQTTAPTESTRRMVSRLQEPLEVILFYPGANEVKENLLSYFEPLRDLSDRFRLRVVDQPMEPTLAREHKVSNNGVILFSYGEKTEKLQVGMKLEAAKSKLSKIDPEFRKIFHKLVMEERIAYFTTGHEERGSVPVSGATGGATINLLKTLLRSLNFKVKSLGIAQGLAGDIPDDAGIVFVVDPGKDFQDAELEALRRYLASGGRLFAALEPESRSNFPSLLDDFGLRFEPTLLANDKQYMRRLYNKSDRYNLYTNRFTSHTSVTTLSRSASSLALVLFGTGFLVEAEREDGAEVSMTVRSMPSTWADTDRDMEADEGEEVKIYDLAAAVSLSVEASPTAGDERGDPAGSQGSEGEARLVVLADADALGDEVIRNLGNYYFCSDAVKWLLGEDTDLGDATAAEDVPIVHTRKEDVVWFYSTIFAIPLLVMGVGILYNVRRRGAGARGKGR